MLVLATLTLVVVPARATTTPGPTFSASQLAFAGVMSFVSYGGLVFVQAIRHRE